MVKKKRNRNLVIGVILVVALLFFLNFRGLSPLAVAGTSTLSLSQAQLQSNNNFLDGKVWILSFRSGGLSQRYFGSFSPSDIQSATNDNIRTTQSFSIDVEYEDQKCSYPITGATGNRPIFDVERVTWTNLLGRCTVQAANDHGLSNILYFGQYSSTLTNNCFAFGYNTQTPVGNINSPDLESEFEIKINAGSEFASKRINTLSGTTQGNIGDFAYSIWQGNLVSGKSCPDKDPFIPIYVNGVWRIGDESSYREYLSLVSSSPTINKDNQDIWLNNVGNAITRAKQSRSFGTLDSSTSFSNAVIKITLQDQIQFPITTLYIKADTLGIFTPTPEIRLFSPNSECFRTGDQGSISVGLENIGDEAGTWNVFAECESPFESTRNIQVSLQPGESVTRHIPLTATATSETTRSCTIFAESPAGTKSVNVGTCVKPQITCTANQKFCSVSGTNEVIKQCSSDGATSQIIETCSQGNFCENAECKVGEKIPEEGFFSKLFNSIGSFFKGIFEGVLDFFFILKLVLTILAFIFTLIFTNNMFKSVKFLQVRNSKIRNLLGIIFGGFAAFLVFTMFWTGVIIVSIVLVIIIAIIFIFPTASLGVIRKSR